MRRVNLDTLEIEEVPKIKDKTYVYILSDVGNWDYEHVSQIDIFKDFNTALDWYKVRIDESRKNMRNYLNEKDIIENNTIKIEQEYASFETYEKEDYDRINNTISIEKKEVI